MKEWTPYGQLPAAGPGAVPPVSVGGFNAGPAADDTAICAVSGKRYPKREMIQYEGQWVSAEHRDEFFQRMREGVSPTAEMRYAGFWIRFVAKFIDGLIVGVVGMIINLVLAFLILGSANYFTAQMDPENLGPFILFQLVSFLSGIAVAIGYIMIFIPRHQATPGKMAMGLKLVRGDGSRISTGRAIGRYFAEWLNMFTLTIGYIIAAFDDQKRALHDHICDTRVIKTRD